MENYSKQELRENCEFAWNEAEYRGYVSSLSTTKDDIDEMAYDILGFGDIDVDDLGDEEFDECIEILKSFLN